MRSTYIDQKGGMTIEKEDSVSTSKKNARKSRKQEVLQEQKNVPASLMIDTAYSYQQAQFTMNPSENGGAECLFCGNKTAYDNRHVCADCWKLYKNDIFESLKTALADFDVSIQ